jgi:hypothetical protein
MTAENHITQRARHPAASSVYGDLSTHRSYYISETTIMCRHKRKCDASINVIKKANDPLKRLEQVEFTSSEKNLHQLSWVIIEGNINFLEKQHNNNSMACSQIQGTR